MTAAVSPSAADRPYHNTPVVDPLAVLRTCREGKPRRTRRVADLEAENELLRAERDDAMTGALEVAALHLEDRCAELEHFQHTAVSRIVSRLLREEAGALRQVMSACAPSRLSVAA